MKILYSVKSYPIREIKIANKINSIDKYMEFDGVAFSKRTFIDLKKYNEDYKLYKNIYNFTDYCSDNIKKLRDIALVNKKLYEYEIKYNIPVNKVLYADRTLVNYNENHQRKLLFLLIEYINKIITDNKYKAIIGELSSASDLIMFYLCKYYNLKYIFFWHGRIVNRFEFSDIDGKRIGLKEKYEKYKVEGINNEDRKILDSYLNEMNKDMTPDYMKYTDTTKKNKNINYLKEYRGNKLARIKAFIFSYLTDRKFSCDMPSKIIDKIAKVINKKLFKLFKKPRLNKFYKNTDKHDRYYLLPLHYQPEASTMTFAQDYLNQFAFIENISRLIPGGTYLYVKEHPSMYIYRRIKYYKKLSKIKNVKIIRPEANISDLLDGSEGVITLTNTTGYEAIIKDKPVFVFGNVFYWDYDYAFKCDSYKSFRDNIEKSLKWNEEKEIRSENRICFIMSALNSLKKGNLNNHVLDANVLSEDNIKLISEQIIYMLKE